MSATTNIGPLTGETIPDGWVVHETEQFTIIFRGDDPFAVAAAAEIVLLAPQVWERTTTQMGYAPKKRVPVVLRGDTAYANGYFTPLPPHIELFISAPSRYQLGAATESWLELVFTHELIHYIHLTRPRGFFGTASRLFGPLTSAGSILFMPGWAIEAPTVYAETTLTSGGRGTDPFFAMTWLAPIYEDEMYSYDEAGFPPPLPPEDRIYSAGYLINDYLRRTYGDEAYHRLNDTFMRAPFLGMRRAIRRTTGLSADSFFRSLQREIELRSAQRFTLPPGDAVSPTDRPGHHHLVAATNRGVVAWAAGPRHPGALYLLPPEAATMPDPIWSWRRILPVSPTDASSVTVDDDLTRVVVAVAAPDYTGAGPRVIHSDLFLVTLTGDAGTRRLTRRGQFLHPALSRDGTRLVALQRRGSSTRLVSVSLEDGSVSPLYDPGADAAGPTSPAAGAPRGEVRLHTPRFSPDGTVIAVVRNRAGEQDILLLDAVTGALRGVVGQAGVREYDPLFSDGALLYGSDEAERLVLKGIALDDIAATASPGSAAGGGHPSGSRTDEPGSRDAPGVPRFTGTTLVEDPIGAYTGIAIEGDILYGTYRSTGYAIRRAPEASVPADATATAVTPDTTPSAGAGPGDHLPDGRSGSPSPARRDREGASASRGSAPPQGSVLSPRRYRDVPRPVFWFPLATVRGGSEEATVAEVGAFALAASTLERHQLEATALFDAGSGEPSGSISYSFIPGATTFGAAIAIGGDEERDEYTGNVTAQRALWYDRGIDRSRGFVGTISGGYEVTVEEGKTDEVPTATATLRLFGYRDGAGGLFYGESGGEVTTRIGIEGGDGGLDGDGPEVVSITEGSIRSRPGRGRLYVVPVGVYAVSRSDEVPERFPYRGGGFETVGSGALARGHHGVFGRLEARIDLGPYAAAARGVASSGSALSAYVEQAGVFGPARIVSVYDEDRGVVETKATDPGFRWENHSVAGVEIAADLYFNTIPLRVTLGGAMRLPHDADAGEREYRIYLSLGGLAVDEVDDAPRRSLLR
ncbi:MAG: TolB family protein [Alkalispirochaeta sp.]